MIDKWTKSVSGAALLGALVLSGCAADGARNSEEVSASSEAVVEAPAESFATEATASTATATGPAFILGTVKDTKGRVVPGVFVNIAGPVSHAAVTDSDGVYFFGNLPNGTYTVKASKSGGTFSGTKTVAATSAGIEAAFTCNSGCEGTGAVDPFRELTIVDKSVVDDPRASNALDGPWSFRFLLEQMAPKGTDPSDFVNSWLQGFKASAGPINGFPVADRSIDAGLLVGKNLATGKDIWPKKSNGKIDLAQSPFQLLAIVNRTDLHIVGDGEARFVFGLIDTQSVPGDTLGQSFTVIFEYRLPVTDTLGTPILRNTWINEFHALSSLTLGSASYNAKLQAITDQFTRAGTTPINPNGSSISQVRTNEIQFGSPWQLREFHLVNVNGQGALKLSPTARSADFTLNDTSALATFIKGNALKFDHGLETLSSVFIGGQSDEVGNGAPVWSFSGVKERERHSFAGQTCNGCHSGETVQLDSFYMISPQHVGNARVGTDGKDSLSGFVTDVEFPRRTRFIQNRLGCTGGSNCSPGAEPMAN